MMVHTYILYNAHAQEEQKIHHSFIIVIIICCEKKKLIGVMSNTNVGSFSDPECGKNKIIPVTVYLVTLWIKKKNRRYFS
jgi:hypothetical protein